MVSLIVSGSRFGFSRLDVLVGLFCVAFLASILAGFASGEGFQGGVNALKCKSNLRQIGIGAANYQTSWDERFPDSNGASFLAALYADLSVSDNGVFLCPGSKHKDETGAKLFRTYAQGLQGGPGDADGTSYLGRQNRFDSAHTMYDPQGLGNLKLRVLKNASKEPLAADEESGWHGELRNFLFLDGHVERITPSDERFKNLLAPLIAPGQDG